MATVMSKRRKWALDALERVGWTAVQVVASTVTVEMLNLPAAYIPLGAALLAALKAAAARKIGRDDSASTVPGV